MEPTVTYSIYDVLETKSATDNFTTYHINKFGLINKIHLTFSSCRSEDLTGGGYFAVEMDIAFERIVGFIPVSNWADTQRLTIHFDHPVQISASTEAKFKYYGDKTVDTVTYANILFLMDYIEDENIQESRDR